MPSATPKKLLVIGAGRFQRAGIRKAVDMGVHVTAVDADHSAEGFKSANLARVIDFSDLALLRQALSGEKFDGVTAFASDVSMPAVSQLCAEYGCPGIGPGILQNVLRKDAMRERFKEGGLNAVPFCRVSKLSQAQDFFYEMAASCVMKPVNASGSRGVSKIDSIEGLLSAYELAGRHSSTREVLIERFIDGKEVAVDGFFVNGRFIPLVVTDKERTDPPALLDETLYFPSRLPQDTLQGVLQCAQAMILATKVDNTPFHLEIIIGNEGRFYPVEIAARGAGFKVYTDIVPALSGVDVLKWQIELAFGIRHEYRPQSGKLKACLFFIGVDKEGVAGGWDEEAARALLTDRDELLIYCQRGERVKALANGSCRIGHGILYGDDLKELHAKKNQVLERLNFQVTVS